MNPITTANMSLSFVTCQNKVRIAIYQLRFTWVSKETILAIEACLEDPPIQVLRHNTCKYQPAKTPFANFKKKFHCPRGSFGGNEAVRLTGLLFLNAPRVSACLVLIKRRKFSVKPPLIKFLQGVIIVLKNGFCKCVMLKIKMQVPC